MSVTEGKGVQRKLYLRLPSESNHHVSRVALGTTFQKRCGRAGTFVGTLMAHDPVQDLYEIRYNDDDVEELTWVDLEKLLRVSGDTVTAHGAVPPLCQEASTKMPLAAALQLQKNLLAKVGYASHSFEKYPIVESTTATAAAQALKSVQLRPSTSESDSTVCGSTTITAHKTCPTANPDVVEEPLKDVAPIRKSPRVPVPSEAMLNIASQFASSESETNENSSDSDQDFRANLETEQLDCPVVPTTRPAVVLKNDKVRFSVILTSSYPYQPWCAKGIKLSSSVALMWIASGNQP
jgi:hypothetical protein